MIKIMFVCTGNVCRSPMAHHYMQKKINEKNLKNDFLISSCGTYAVTGEHATDNAVLSMKKYGIDMEKHRATNIDDINIRDYDYVITLTMQHKETVLYYYPELKGKVLTLKEMVRTEDKYVDIDDPWGLNIMVYKDTAEEIVQNVDKLIEILLRK